VLVACVLAAILCARVCVNLLACLLTCYFSFYVYYSATKLAIAGGRTFLAPPPYLVIAQTVAEEL